MTIAYKDQQLSFPSSLNEITLQQRISFNEEHGKLLDERLKAIAEIKDEFERETELNQWHLENAARTFSFYTGLDLDTVANELPIADLVNVYNSEIQELIKQEQNIDLKTVYRWNDENWCINTPELKPTDKMAFNEFIVGKEIVRALHAAGKGKWETLPYLCATYLRKEGEPFTEELVQEDSERLKLMHSLPLDIATAVGFFLTSILNIYSTISPYSNAANQKESIPAPTSTNGDG